MYDEDDFEEFDDFEEIDDIGVVDIDENEDNEEETGQEILDDDEAEIFEDEEEQVDETRLKKNLAKKRIGGYECMIVKNEEELNSVLLTSHQIYIDFPITSSITAPYFSRFEKAKIIQRRAQLIEKGEPSSIDTEGETRSYEIAKKELELHKCPMYTRRNRFNKPDRFFFLSVNAKNAYGDWMYNSSFV
jgi:DNA-directed RNA polymerase subunit K/omega/ribosomal protein S6